jgi:hypothetical protein
MCSRSSSLGNLARLVVDALPRELLMQVEHQPRPSEQASMALLNKVLARINKTQPGSPEHPAY